MADNVAITAGTGTTIGTDDCGGVQIQRVKVTWGVDGTATDVATAGSGLPIQDGGNVISVDDGGSNLSIDDGGNSITVDGAVTVTNAGTFAVQVDGNALTSLQLIDNLVLAEDAAHGSGDPGLMVLGVRKATTPADRSAGATDGDYEPFQVDGNGRLYVNAVLYNSSGSELTPSSDQTLDSAIGTTGPLMVGRGSTATPSAMSTDGDATAMWLDLNGRVHVTAEKAEDAAHSSGDIGMFVLGVRAAAPTERSAGPTDGDYEPFGVNEVGALWATLTPSANGGCTTFMASGSDGSSILVATAQAIKASAGVLYGYYAYNPEAAVTFVHFYNTAAGSVTVGTTNPLFTIAIPAGSAANLALPYGITFSNAGWSCAATTTAGGNGAPATGVSLVAWYK